MNQRRTQLLFGLIFLFTSCGFVISENEALSKNDEALTAYNSGDYEKAIQIFKEAIKSPQLSLRNKAKIYRNIANTFFEIGEADSSIHYSQLAANCFKEDSYEFLVNTADIQLISEDIDGAVLNLWKAYTLKPDELEVNNSLGLIYLGDYGDDFSDPERALDYNLKAFEINKDRVTEDVLARNYFEIGDYKNAEIHFTKLRSQFPDMVDYPFSLGMIKYHQGKMQEADELFEHVLATDSSLIEVIETFKDNIEN